MTRFKFEDSNLGHIVDEIEEEAEEFENDISESILDHSFDEEIMEEEEIEEFANDVSESILDEEIIEEEEEVFANDVSESILDEEIEEFEVDISENMETTMEYDRHLLNEGYQQQGLNQTSGRLARTARMRVNTNYVHYRIQVPQLILDDIEEEEMEEEDDTNEFVDQDMSEYFETSTYYATPAMDIDGDDEEEEQEACAICLLEYKDEDTIAILQCGHEFHDECINKWLQRKKTCPFCRASVFAHNTR
ncbi:E3 ubiquitin ligase BIG BROTHER-related-like [Solanum dulcamara]|uniref:E3 ubiquitin ligase BIG BROTHER-related-like n=1 Tax=Solanum dulcamara TaxID=45834 RepID=UPI0024856976|nr:E3 ubiquitin ligase BIG BROTHER-related-like [Solanum dulcamara]